MGQWVVVIQSIEKSGRKINSMLEFALQKGGGYLMRFRIDNLRAPLKMMM